MIQGLVYKQRVLDGDAETLVDGGGESIWFYCEQGEVSGVQSFQYFENVPRDCDNVLLLEGLHLVAQQRPLPHVFEDKHSVSILLIYELVAICVRYERLAAEQLQDVSAWANKYLSLWNLSCEASVSSSRTLQSWPSTLVEKKMQSKEG